MRGARVALKAPGGFAARGREVARDGEGRAEFLFDAEGIAEGLYALELVNPGGLSCALEGAILVRRKLPAPIGLSPADRTAYGPAALRGMDSIRFSWEPVQGAARYTFSLRGPGGAEPIPSPGVLSGCSYLLADLSVRDRGEFPGAVEPEGADEGRGPIPAASAARASFRIELPPLAEPSAKGGAVFYGR